MKSRTAQCPACGGPVTFKVSTSLVAVCDYCHSVVARGDKKPEDCGKISDIAELNSPITSGMTGSYQNKAFHVTGCVQYQHPSGAVWNEWYLCFPGEKWGWLAEAQGNLYLMFEQRLKSGSSLANFDTIKIGQSFAVREDSLSVTEKAIAQVAGAQGEIPWAVRPGIEHRYADLKSTQGLIGTLDFGETESRFFLGKRVTLEALGLSANSNWQAPKDIAVNALQVSCPHCGGSLQLFAPDSSLRVTCPSCNSLLETRQGNLAYLETLGGRKVNPVLPLGSKGQLLGKEYVVVGFMQRFVLHNGTSFPWSEYLLYNPEVHFRWLVKTRDGHWSFVEQIDYPANPDMGDLVFHETKQFRKYSQGDATVSYVVGEFPWKVHIGQRTKISDYIAPPSMLSFEKALTDGQQEGEEVNQEVTVSKGTYVSIEEIEKGFALDDLRRPLGVGSIQPSPKMGMNYLWATVGFFLFMAITFQVMKWMHPRNPPNSSMLWTGFSLIAILPALVLVYKYSFEVKRWHNSEYNPYSRE